MKIKDISKREKSKKVRNLYFKYEENALNINVKKQILKFCIKNELNKKNKLILKTRIKKNNF